MLRDSFGRVIDYLRVSVTDRCNFRCVYCMPEDGYPVSPKEELLTYEEILRVVKIASELGIRKVRLTGGEPLIRKDLPLLIKEIKEQTKTEDLSCTTNGFLLPEMAHSLKEAGLDRVNISLDTLDKEKFVKIARRGNLDKVLDGIKAAEDVGLDPIKINCVLMKGFNDDEVVDFAKMSVEKNYHIRFIELMPIRWNMDDTDSFTPLSELANGKGLIQIRTSKDEGMLSDSQMRKMLVTAEESFDKLSDYFGELIPTEILTNGPARTYKIRDARGTVGFITQISNDFCVKCNRLRLTADGQLRPCLMSDGEVDLRTPLRNGESDEFIREIFLHVVKHKPERHYLAEGQKVHGRTMSQIGG